MDTVKLASAVGRWEPRRRGYRQWDDTDDDWSLEYDAQTEDYKNIHRGKDNDRHLGIKRNIEANIDTSTQTHRDICRQTVRRLVIKIQCSNNILDTQTDRETCWKTGCIGTQAECDQRSITEDRTSVIHMPGSIEYLQADNTATSVDNGIGLGTSASQWHKYALAILCWQQLICTISGAETRPSAHTDKAPKKQLNIWYSSVLPTIRPGETRGQETLLQQTRDASGATWNGLGQWPPPDQEWGRERESRLCIATSLINSLCTTCKNDLTIWVKNLLLENFQQNTWQIWGPCCWRRQHCSTPSNYAARQQCNNYFSL